MAASAPSTTPAVLALLLFLLACAAAEARPLFGKKVRDAMALVRVEGGVLCAQKSLRWVCVEGGALGSNSLHEHLQTNSSASQHPNARHVSLIH